MNKLKLDFSCEPRIEEIMAWSYMKYGTKYTNALETQNITLKIDMEHNAEQELKKLKQKKLQYKLDL